MINDKINRKGVGTVILAAGESKRMNYPKSLLLFDDESRFIDKIVSEFNDFGCGEIVIVINEDLKKYIIPEDFSNDRIKVIINNEPEFGRFFSIRLGIKKLKDVDFCFIHNADNPFVNNYILEKLFINRYDSDYVMPSINGIGGHPILLGKSIINCINKEDRNNLNLKEYLKDFKASKIEVNDNSILVNINTLEDYKKYFRYETRDIRYET